jgi:urease gamma subunit
VLLTQTELERLTIFSAAELARKRRARGLLLNYPEAVAIIVDEVMEAARDGKSVAELISFGSTLLTTDDVMPGVAELMPFVQVEPVLKSTIRFDRARRRSKASFPVKSPPKMGRSRSTLVGGP